MRPLDTHKETQRRKKHAKAKEHDYTHTQAFSFPPISPAMSTTHKTHQCQEARGSTHPGGGTATPRLAAVSSCSGRCCPLGCLSSLLSCNRPCGAAVSPLLFGCGSSGRFGFGPDVDDDDDGAAANLLSLLSAQADDASAMKR